MILLIKLFLAHLIGDFVFQTKKSIKKKEKKKLKFLALYAHIAFHFILLILLVWDLSLWLIIVIIIQSHFIIDVLKLTFQKKKTKRLSSFLDQIIHITVIF